MKNDKLTPCEYLTQLTFEWFSWKLRSKVYENEEYCKFANDLATKKRVFIDQVSKKYNLATIFDSKEKFDLYFKKFTNKTGLPKLKFLNNGKEASTLFWDKNSLFRVGESIMIGDKNGVIVENFPEENICKVILDGDFIIEVNYGAVTLLLDRYLDYCNL